MANVDLVDLIPILKAILAIKKEYKIAIETGEDDFSLYPVLTENFLDSCYNDGYEIAFKQAYREYLNIDEVNVPAQREMREIVPSNYSLSGDADYDALTSIMRFCLSVRQNLKEILDLDTDLFELYPPAVVERGAEFYAAGYNDGYADAITTVTNITISAPAIERDNNYVNIRTTFNGAITYYSVGNTDNWAVFDPAHPIVIPEGSTITVYAYSSAGTKNSEVVDDTFSYDDVLSPSIVFSNNIISIQSNYMYDPSVVTMYKLSSWENYNEFLPYDDLPIPITYDTVVWAYNQFSDGSISSTVSQTCTYEASDIVRPATPVINYSSSTNYLTISCSTSGATVYYMKEGSTSGWIPYTGPIKLVETGTYVAMSIKDGIESLPSNPVTCTVETPSGTSTVFAPQIICQNNTVTVFTSQSGVTLYYRPVYSELTSWVQYSGPFSITQTNDYQAKAVLNSDSTKVAYSPIVTCEYLSANPGGGTTPGGGSGTSDDTFIAKPLIFFNNNVVSMTPVTAGSTCKYRIYGSTSWIDYSVPFTLTESCIIEAIATKDGNESALAQLNCIVDGTPTMTCYMTFVDDVLTITTNVSGGIIYYMKGDTTWEVYSGPITVNETAFYYSKVTKNGEESQTFQLYCEIDETDYYSTYFTVENICDYAIGISIRLERDRPGAHMFDIYYNQYTTSMGTGERVWLGWREAPSSGYITLYAHDKVIFKGSPQYIDYAAKTFYIQAYGTPSGHSDSKYAQYIAYGNLISLLAGDSFPTIPQNIPSGLNITLYDNCYRCNNIIYYSDWVVRKDYRSSDVPTPIISFNQITNILSFTSPLDSFLEIKYSFDGYSWITYSEPIQVDSDCTVYYKAIGQYYNNSNWLNKESDIGSEELIINTE